MALEINYIRQLSSTLRNFRIINIHRINFSCPICGDSKKNHKKARGYLIQENGKYFYYCHNCNVNLNFNNFLQTLNPVLYEEYVRERFKERTVDKQYKLPTKKELKELSHTIILQLPKISQLKENHPAYKFVKKRLIPTKYHSWLFYTDDFKEYVNNVIPNYFENTSPKEPRIIIPLLNTNKKLLGFQGRSIDNSISDRLRYITIMLDQNNPKLFGLDRINFNYRNYIFEGPFDSMFIENSIATCGGKITSILENYSFPTDNSVIVYDNEPRNKDVVRNIERAIDNGYKVVIWPKNIKTKDINDLVLSLLPKRYNNETILNIGKHIEQNILQPNSYSGLKARLRFVNWKKR